MLNIKNPEARRLASTLAQKTGKTLTEVVVLALREKQMRENDRRTSEEIKNELLGIGKRCAALPDTIN